MLKRARGFSLFELTVAITLIGLIGLVLFDRLLYYQEEAEKTAMEQTLTILRVALQIRKGELMASGQDARMASLPEENPMNWLARKPPNYAGEADGVPAGALQGSWYYDRRDKALVYVAKHRRHLTVAGADAGQIRFHVRRMADENAKALPEMAVNNGIGALFLQAMPPYRWF